MGALQNPRWEDFAHLYYAGPDHIRGNATAAYAEAYDREKDHTASVEGSRLLKRPEVRARIEEIRSEAAEAARLRARDWWEHYPEAQRTLLLAATGRLDELRGGDGAPMSDQAMRSAVEAAQEIVSRCEGTVQQRHEHKVTGSAFVVHVAGPDHGGGEGRQDPGAERSGGGAEGRERLRSGPRVVEVGK